VIEKEGILENNNEKEKGGDVKKNPWEEFKKRICFPSNLRQGEKTNL
jgi:hypothetical protein